MSVIASTPRPLALIAIFALTAPSPAGAALPAIVLAGVVHTPPITIDDIKDENAAHEAPVNSMPSEDMQSMPFPERGPPNDRDAQPLIRIPPRYPEECWADASAVETVVLEFDVSPNGGVENVKVLEFSNPCLIESAVEAVKRWRYAEIKDYQGGPRWRRGVQTKMIFALNK